jgi:hypothetical protein
LVVALCDLLISDKLVALAEITRGVSCLAIRISVRAAARKWDDVVHVHFDERYWLVADMADPAVAIPNDATIYRFDSDRTLLGMSHGCS